MKGVELLIESGDHDNDAQCVCINICLQQADDAARLFTRSGVFLEGEKKKIINQCCTVSTPVDPRVSQLSCIVILMQRLHLQAMIIKTKLSEKALPALPPCLGYHSNCRIKDADSGNAHTFSEILCDHLGPE